MFPINSSNYEPDGGLGDTEFLCERGLTSLAGDIQRAYYFDLLFCEFGKAMIFTAMNQICRKASMPSFLDAILHIGAVVSLEQVDRPVASGVVAMMADQDSLSDRTFDDLPSLSVRAASGLLAAWKIFVNATVAVFVAIARPFQARKALPRQGKIVGQGKYGLSEKAWAINWMPKHLSIIAHTPIP